MTTAGAGRLAWWWWTIGRNRSLAVTWRLDNAIWFGLVCESTGEASFRLHGRRCQIGLTFMSACRTMEAPWARRWAIFEEGLLQ
jgi:hypothetical protein